VLAGLGKQEREYREGGLDQQFCVHCHGEVTMDSVRMRNVTVTRGRRIKITLSCPRCRKIILTKYEDSEKVRRKKTEKVENVKQKVDDNPKKKRKVEMVENIKEKVDDKPKKKRKPKEVNAGLILPSAKPSSKAGNINANKLKLLLSKPDQPKRGGGLQDFLKRL